MIIRMVSLLSLLFLTGCFTDPATRIAFDIEAGARQVGHVNGSEFTVEHSVSYKKEECGGSYTVQLDKAGAIIIWCKDDRGAQVVSSHSTSYHRRFVETPQTYIVQKKAGEILFIRLKRQNDRILIADVK